MKKVRKWFLNNWGSIVSLIGLFAAIYFGIFYVPNYVKNTLSEKERSIHSDLIQSTQELVYNDSICEINEIICLIKGKELRYGISYGYSINELLIQVQESFMEQKFLPIQKRKELIAEIELLINKIPQVQLSLNKTKPSSTLIKSIILRWLSILFSIITVVLGIVSIRYRNKKEREKNEEISNQIEFEFNNVMTDKTSNAHEYENSIIKTIKDTLGLIGNEKLNKIDSAIDYKFEYRNVKYYVLIKYLQKSKVGLSSVKSFLYELISRKGIALIIYTTDVTSMVQKEIEEYKLMNPDIKVLLIKSTNIEDLKQYLINNIKD